MPVSHKKMSGVLRRMACLFRPPVDLATETTADEVARLWVTVLGDAMDDASVSHAAMEIARSLRRFPTPVDFLELAPLFKTTAAGAAPAATQPTGQSA